MKVCEVLEPEWNNNGKDWDNNGTHPEFGQYITNGQLIKKRMDALRHHDLLLFRQLENFVDNNPEDVMVAAFPSINDIDYEYDQGIPPLVEQNPLGYVNFQIGGAWFHEEMRDRDLEEKGDFSDAGEVVYVNKRFPQLRVIQGIVKKHNEIEMLLRTSFSWKW